MEGAYATWAGVPTRRVRVTVVPASVLITVTLEVASMADATALLTRVNDINTPQAHEGILTSAGVTGVAVLAVSAATRGAVGATPEPPPGSGDAGDGGGSSPIGIIAGAAGGGIAILILVAVCMARKTPSSTNTVGELPKARESKGFFSSIRVGFWTPKGTPKTSPKAAFGAPASAEYETDPPFEGVRV
uniref:Uncharacterized protein n=1 Tax=Haptolina ericina TaxID=156174 RepID=A0A7S3F497_9EUKA